MFVQLQFDQEARRAMILQIGHFKDNVIFCRIPSWFLLYEYLIYLNAVISNGSIAAQSAQKDVYPIWVGLPQGNLTQNIG